MALGIERRRLRNKFAARHTFGRRRKLFNPWAGYRDEGTREGEPNAVTLRANTKKPWFFDFPVHCELTIKRRLYIPDVAILVDCECQNELWTPWPVHARRLLKGTTEFSYHRAHAFMFEMLRVAYLVWHSRPPGKERMANPWDQLRREFES